MHTFKQIIENQEKYKTKILRFFVQDLSKIKKELFLIKSEDEFILNEKKKFKELLKASQYKKHLSNLFFKSKKRNRNYYVWWDEENEEGKILAYEKK